MELLLEAGANIEEKDWNGMTALIWAADIAPKRVIELLLRHGANIEAKDNSGFTPLMMASKDRPKDIVDLLLTAGARLEVRLLHCHALMYATSYRNVTTGAP